MYIYFPLSILILLATGWLKELPTELKITKERLVFWFSLICCLSILPPLSISNELEIDLGFVILVGLWIYLFSRVPIARLFTLFSLQLMLGSILFLYHEVAKVQLAWDLPHFQWFVHLFSLAEALIAFKTLGERICLVFGGLTFAQSGILYLYHDRLSPVVFPSMQFLHTFWLVLISLIFLHYLIISIPVWSKNWRFSIWTRRR